MSIMAKTPSGYKKIGSAYLGEQPVDKVFNANGDVVYALQRELTGVPPLLFKGKEQSELLNYRIYGDTVDGNSVGDLVESGQHAGEYVVPVTVEGKNLLQNTATSRMVNDVIFTVNDDGSVTCNGTAKKDTACLIKKINLYEANYILTGCPEGGTRSTYSMHYTNNVDSAKVDYGEGVFFTPYNSEQYSNIAAIVFIATGYACENLTFYPMIRKADIEDDTYEPYHAPVTTPIYLPEPIKMVGDEAEYIDYAEQKQHRVRKNLLQNTATSQTINGVTFTVNSDGSVTCNGTATERIGLRINTTMLRSGDYICSNNIQGSSTSYYVDWSIQAAPSTTLKEYSQAIKITTDESVNVSAWINIVSGYTCNNLTFYPMIRKADISDDTYEPYIENTDVDVTLPALPTLTGTNEMSVDTEVQPSRMDIKGRIKSLT